MLIKRTAGRGSWAKKRKKNMRVEWTDKRESWEKIEGEKIE